MIDDEQIKAARALVEKAAVRPQWRMDVLMSEDELEMWNACKTLVPRLLDEIERLRSDEATMKLSRMIGLGDPVRPDIHARVERERDALRAEVERLEGKR